MMLKQLKSVNFLVEKCSLVDTLVLVNVEGVAKAAFMYRARNCAQKSYSVDIHVLQSVQISVHHAKRSVHTRVSMGGVVMTARIDVSPVPIDVNGGVGIIGVRGSVAKFVTGRNVIGHAQRN